jgi:hypothetical protein
MEGQTRVRHSIGPRPYTVISTDKVGAARGSGYIGHRFKPLNRPIELSSCAECHFPRPSARRSAGTPEGAHPRRDEL